MTPETKEEKTMKEKTMKEKTFWERFNEHLDNQKRLLTSTEYFDWLYDFTKKTPRFTDTDWLYEKEPGMTERDCAQVALLTDFFTAVNRYHDKNLLQANTEGCAAWYNIKYKDAYFAVGIRVGQGAENFVTRYANCKEMGDEAFIRFEDILENKEASGLAEKNKALQSLQDIANLLRDLKVPKEAVDKVIKQAYEKKE